MASKRSIYDPPSNKDIEPTEEVIEEVKPFVSTISTKSVYVPVRLLKEAIYKITTPGGRKYIFNGAGAEVKVLEEDVAFLTDKKRQGGCCGGQTSKPIFEIVRR
jgi:hypothetical protein